MSERILQGDALEALRTLEPESAHACVTSPPYYNLRNYGVDGQIGMEKTPEDFVTALVAVFREVRRVLRSDGTLWVNIGDSYATRSGAQPPTNTRNRCGHTEKRTPQGYKYKDLIGIPWMLAFALRADGWYLRQDIIWEKPNAMPESVKDRCTKSHEYIFLLSKTGKYYFDNDAIREPFTDKRVRVGERRSYTAGCASSFSMESGHIEQKGGFAGLPLNPRGRNKRDVWSVNTSAFRGAHFAVFPEKLIEPCILAGCPPGGTVIDPFTGSGTTGAVAKRLGRNFVGIEINPEYCEIAQKRIAEAPSFYEQIQI